MFNQEYQILMTFLNALKICTLIGTMCFTEILVYRNNWNFFQLVSSFYVLQEIFLQSIH